jgi:hypothetical protein
VSSDSLIPTGSRWSFRSALVLAMAADAVQIFIMPLFAEGALSPADDLLDIGMAVILVRLLGWHWEFLPAFAGELIPGVDLVPFWTLSVMNVYRKWKQAEPQDKPKSQKEPPFIEGEYKSL